MVSQDKNNDLPDKDTLRKYLQGKLSPEEAHRLEKLILNDPLYRDALDGLETLSEEELELDLQDLSRQIGEKTHTSARGTAFYFYRVAAAILLLAVFSYVIVYTTSRMGEVSKNETLSQKSAMPEEDEQVPADMLEEESDTTYDSIESDDPGVQQSDTPSLKESPEVVAAVVSEEPEEETMLDEVEDSFIHETKDEGELTEEERDLEIQDEISAVAVADEEKSIAFKENVPEELNLEQEADKGIVAEESASVLNNQVDAAGVNRAENKLARKAERQTAAIPAAADQAVPYSEIETEDILKPAPVGGYEMYNQYINENLKYPEEESVKKIEGNVKLRFIINTDSIPDRIRIVESLSPACDEEAKRLLLNGPKWIPVYRNGEISNIDLEYNIRFQLEE